MSESFDRNDTHAEAGGRSAFAVLASALAIGLGVTLLITAIAAVPGLGGLVLFALPAIALVVLLVAAAGGAWWSVGRGYRHGHLVAGLTCALFIAVPLVFRWWPEPGYRHYRVSGVLQSEEMIDWSPNFGLAWILTATAALGVILRSAVRRKRIQPGS